MVSGSCACTSITNPKSVGRFPLISRHDSPASSERMTSQCFCMKSTFGRDRCSAMRWTQWPTAAVGSGMYCERRPWLIGFQVVPLVRGEGFAGVRRGVVDELVALAGRHAVRRLRHSTAGRLPRLAAVARALDDLSEPPARLRRVEAVGIGGGSLHVINLPAGEVRAAHVPLLALAVRCQDEGSLSRADQYPYTAHDALLS